MKHIITTLAIAVSLTSCASQQPQNKPAELTFASAKTNLVKGKTTQQEVIQTFGSPNITTRNAQGKEVWTYSRQSYDQKSSGAWGSLFLVGGATSSATSGSSSFDLIITFDENDVVEDYSIVTSQF